MPSDRDIRGEMREKEARLLLRAGSFATMEVGWAVSTDNRNEAFLDRTPVQPGEETHAYRAAGFAASAALHGLALFATLMLAQHGMQTARSGLLSVPVEIDRVNPDLRVGEKSASCRNKCPCQMLPSPVQDGATGKSATAATRSQASDAIEAPPARRCHRARDERVRRIRAGRRCDAGPAGALQCQGLDPCPS